jgi:hypothetical protein
MIRALLLLGALTSTISFAAGEAPSVPLVAHSAPPHESIAAYADPSELPNLSQTQLDAFVLRFATCAECWPLNVARMASLGNKILGSLAKACEGDDRFLDTEERQRSYEATYYRLAPYMSPPVERSAYIEGETDKLKRIARTRAHEVLLAIGTPDAHAIACGEPVP